MNMNDNTPKTQSGKCTPQEIYIRGANEHRAEVERKIAEYNERHETHFKLADGDTEALTVGSYWGMEMADLRAFCSWMGVVFDG